MKLVKTLIIAGLTLGTAGTVFAQDVVGAAKDVVTDKATDVVKDKGADLVKGAVGTLSTEDKVDIGKKVLLEGKSTEEATIEVVTDKAKDRVNGIAGDAIGDKVGAPGTSFGSSTKEFMQKKDDTIVDTVVDKAKGSATDYSSGTKDTTTTTGSSTSYGSSGTTTSTTTTTAAPAVSCPAGTTAQADGTCMITGNFNPGS